MAIAAAWVPLILLWGDLPHMLTFDDAFYYFTIGRNIADGAGSTFDGLHPTNGYHPLWMLVTAAIYAAGFDGVGAIRAILLLQLLTWLATLWILARVVADAVAGWPALEGRSDRDRAARRGAVLLGILWFALAGNPFVLKLFVNGMETGIAALLAAALLALSVQEDGDPLLRRPLLAAVLASLAFLARTDVAVILAALFLWTLLRRRRPDRAVLLVGAALAAVTALYLASNVVIVEHPMQISGTIKRVDPDGRRIVTAALCVVAAVAVLALARRCSRPSTTTKLPRARGWLATTGWWPAGSLLLLGYEWGFTVEIYLWHYAPQVLWGMVTLVLAVADIYEGATVEAPEGRSSRSLAVAGIVVAPIAVGCAWQVGRFADGEIRSMQLGDRAAAEWIAGHLPADAVVASWDAGVIGYFAERPVVNLDGLVNSYEWHEALGTGTDATRPFLLESGVTHVANHGDVVDGEDPDLRPLLTGLLGADLGEGVELIHRVDYVFAGSTGGTSGRRPFATFVYELPDVAD